MEKSTYITPQIEWIKIDNEITLALESPAVYPNETLLKTPEHFYADPFNANHA